MLFFALLLYASLSRYLFFERGYRYRRRLNERNVQQRLKVILTFLYFPLVIHELLLVLAIKYDRDLSSR